MLKNQLQDIRQLVVNLKKMLSLAVKVDRTLVVNYYLTAGLGALAPVGAGISMKFLIDGLNLQVGSAVTAIPLIIIFILATRYLTILAEDIIKWGLNDTYFDYLLRYKLQNEFSCILIDKISRLDIGHLENTEVQNLLQKARDTVSWRPPDFLRMFRYFFESLSGFLGAFIALIPFGLWIPAIITLISLPRLLFRMKYGNLEWSVWDKLGSVSKLRWYLMYLLTNIATIREMRIFQTQGYLVDKFRDIQNHLLKSQKEPLDKYLKFLILPSFIEVALLFGVALYLLPDVLSGVLSIGSFTLIIAMMDRLNQTANGIAGNFSAVYEHNLYVQYFLDSLALPQLIKDADNALELDPSKPPHIEFKDVSFKYTDRYVLKNITFTIKPGENIAFVGLNGAGKSTIIKLLCRFYDVDEGEILINGINIKNIRLKNWYSFLGTLFQDFVQYHFSVSENITLSKGGKHDEDGMKKAAKLAGATFIERLPKGFEQKLGREFEEGEELSIGEWQKLSIARAFFASPPVLILDEPTSAIDAESEYEIFTNLEKHYKNKTLIFVSHRFSTVRNADRIFVIQDGQVTEEGTHKDLIKKGGRYAQMFKVQAEGYR